MGDELGVGDGVERFGQVNGHDGGAGRGLRWLKPIAMVWASGRRAVVVERREHLESIVSIIFPMFAENLIGIRFYCWSLVP